MPNAQMLFISYAFSAFTFNVHFSCDLHCRRQVPHLDAAVAMTTEKVPTGPGTDAAGSLALMYHECRDGSPIH